MANFVRNDSASVISSLQMDYGDSDEEESSLSGSRNNSIDTKDEDGVLKDVDQSHNDDQNNMDIDIKPPKNDSDPIKEDTLIKAEVSDEGTKYLLGDLKSESNMSAAEMFPFSQRVQINAAPILADAIKEEEATRTPLDEAISDDEDGIPDSKIEEYKSSALSQEINKASPVSPPSQPPPQLQRKTTRLVSYGPDEDFDENSSDSDSEEEAKVESREDSPALSDPSALSRSVQNMSGDDIRIPPEPPGNCSRLLQNKIEDMYERMRSEGLNLNRVIQRKKTFRNPSIYEKLIDYCNIDQKGTNFPPEIYDPRIWGKESYYDELDRAQRKDMEKREKDKKDKTKIEFVVGTKKSSSSIESGYSDEKKRKTKWDAQPSGVVKAHGVQGPGVVNLTATATGTKATVISAVGSLSKKTNK